MSTFPAVALPVRASEVRGVDLDGRQPCDGPSLASSRSGPYNSWATEVLADCHLSDGPSPKPRFSDLHLNPTETTDRQACNGPSPPTVIEKTLGNFCLSPTVETTDHHV
ncbi:hypothetical protein HAX54_026125 [Datura stramonium]|uniref:Uncharacterized protein n=1 Tax=Datura stramonium TaxID=4076 RepID=A0ABS8V2P9_DATST|nr:hypothetical protein [Datura stramonium]